MSSIFLLGHLQKNQLEPKAKSVEDPLYIASNSHFYHLALILKASQVFFLYQIGLLNKQNLVLACNSFLRQMSFCSGGQIQLLCKYQSKDDKYLVAQPGRWHFDSFFFIKKKLQMNILAPYAGSSSFLDHCNNVVGILRHVCHLSEGVPLKNIIATSQYYHSLIKPL